MNITSNEKFKFNCVENEMQILNMYVILWGNESNVYHITKRNHAQTTQVLE